MNRQKFTISDRGIENIDMVAEIHDPRSGGYVIFDGRVRNHNEGKEVTHLEYQAYETLAIAEGEKIMHEAFEKFEIHSARCIHRVGDLQIGEAAVKLIVGAKHRGTAFDACEFIIDELKIRVPIWKNEHYVDGSSGWVECHECSKHSHAPLTHQHDSSESYNHQH